MATYLGKKASKALGDKVVDSATKICKDYVNEHKEELKGKVKDTVKKQ